MRTLLASQTFWLLGIDNQLRRPRAPHVRIGHAGAALVDVIEAGGARWAGSLQEPRIELLPMPPGNALLDRWHERLAPAAREGGWRATCAVDALFEHAWTETAQSLLALGWASEHRVPVIRRVSYAPTPDALQAARLVRDEACRAVSDGYPPNGAPHVLVAASESAGVSAFVLSEKWAGDADIGKLTAHALAGDALTRRLGAAMATLLGASSRPPGDGSAFPSLLT